MKKKSETRRKAKASSRAEHPVERAYQETCCRPKRRKYHVLSRWARVWAKYGVSRELMRA